MFDLDPIINNRWYLHILIHSTLCNTTTSQEGNWNEQLDRQTGQYHVLSQADALTKGLSIVAAMELSGVLQQSSPRVHQVSSSWGES